MSAYVAHRKFSVALLAEGVGRNILRTDDWARPITVALLAEGVGRNAILLTAAASIILSPSSRRAWVEISPLPWWRFWRTVALLAEGVGRNISRDTAS